MCQGTDDMLHCIFILGWRLGAFSADARVYFNEDFFCCVIRNNAKMYVNRFIVSRVLLIETFLCFMTTCSTR